MTNAHTAATALAALAATTDDDALCNLAFELAAAAQFNDEVQDFVAFQFLSELAEVGRGDEVRALLFLFASGGR